MRRRKTGSDPIQNQIKLLITSLEAAVDFASGMLESYEDGEMEYAEEDAENFESYIQRLQDDHEMVVKAFKKRSRMASRRRFSKVDVNQFRELSKGKQSEEIQMFLEKNLKKNNFGVDVSGKDFTVGGLEGKDFEKAKKLVSDNFGVQIKEASRRRVAYNDPCNGTSYYNEDYNTTLEGLEECHDERIRENKVEDAFDYMRENYDSSDDFADMMEAVSSEFRLNSAEEEFLKWHYDTQF